jgi:hypothetical protein
MTSRKLRSTPWSIGLVYDKVSDLREVLLMQANCHETMLRSLPQNEIGTSALEPFRSSLLGPWSSL